ncbi:Alanine--tRNA ligase [Ananas comosus]|uniref:Alanine--tRNA ligase n=1 Tax=Ananas comosus TaxID=4615 RepID=A0A199VPC8_ANACO|nr:Alanine--tRNA ligase [Ananas comosus]
MVFSTDEASNKAAVYAGVPSNRSKDGLAVLEWLTAAMKPLKGKGGGGKNGVAQGQGSESSDASRVEEVIDIATKFAAMKLRFPVAFPIPNAPRLGHDHHLVWKDEQQ